MKKIKLKDIAEISLGIAYRRYLSSDGDKYRIILQKSIKKDGQCEDFEEVQLKNIKEKYFTRKNDILMKMQYPYDVVCIKKNNILISNKIAIIRLKKDYNPDFITHLLTNTHIKKQLHQLGNSKTPHISLKQIKQLQLIIPDIKTQEKYGVLLDLLNEKIVEDKKQLEFDRNLKQAIINDLWSQYE